MTYYHVKIKRANAMKNTVECSTFDNVENIDIHDTCDGAYFEMKYYNLNNKACKLIEPMRSIVSIEMEVIQC